MHRVSPSPTVFLCVLCGFTVLYKKRKGEVKRTAREILHPIAGTEGDALPHGIVEFFRVFRHRIGLAA